MPDHSVRSMFPCHRVLIGLFACAGLVSAEDTDGVDSVDGRFVYVNTPGISTITRSQATSSSGGAVPSDNGSLHPHPVRGYRIELDGELGWRIADPWSAVVGIGAFDTILGSRTARVIDTGTPNGAGSGDILYSAKGRESVHAAGLRLSAGVSYSRPRWRMELTPGFGIGPAIGRVTSSGQFTNDPSNLFALQATSLTASSKTTWLYEAGITLGALYTPASIDHLIVGVGVGVEGFRARVTFRNGPLGSWTDRIGGFGATCSGSIGSRF